MDDYFKYSEVYGEGNEVESWSRNNGDGWSPRCFKSLEYLSTTIGRLIEPFTRPLNEREKEIAPREATMSQLSRERERIHLAVAGSASPTLSFLGPSPIIK